MEHQARVASARLPGHLKRLKIISVLFLIGCVALPSVAQDFSEEVPGSYVMTNISSRHKSFLVPNATSQPDQDLARHHVIPASLLIDFYNTSLSNSNSRNDYHEARELLSVLSNLAGHTLEFYQFHTTATISNKTMCLLRSFNNTVRYEDLRPIKSPHSANLTQGVINHLFVWAPFNIFEGPRYRTDDAGPQFEELAGPIIGQELFNELRTLNGLMLSYIKNASVAVFDDIISRLLAVISKRTWHTTTYDITKWEKDGNRTYRIKKENQNRSLRRKRETNEEYLDPYCHKGEEFLSKHVREIYNVVIVEAAFKRAKNGDGFYSRNYNSWKDWYAASDWSKAVNPLEDGIIQLGRKMAQGYGSMKPYGYKFKDGSFAVGIIGDDVKYGNDNWTLKRYDWVTGDEFAGQIFFDRIGRPVAIVISTFPSAMWGRGLSFIYNNGKWEYESDGDWHKRRFAHSTLSLHSDAPRFFIDKADYSDVIKYGLRDL